MKPTISVLSLTALAALAVTALAHETPDDPATGWPLVLGYPPVSLTAADTAGGTGPRTILVASGACDGLHDNGVTNGLNAYSNATENAFGIRRTLLDDFEVPNGVEWTINELHHTHVWDDDIPGAGVGMEFAIWSDSAGAPDEVIVASMISTSYTEAATGNTFFSRPEAESWSGFDPIVLDAGRYWFEATIIGPDNNFWLTADQIGAECWVNYDDDDPPLARGSQRFGVPSDVNWCLGGTIGVGSTTQFGLRHVPEGQAHLEAIGETLTVTNIGASGDDGFAVQLGDSSDGWAGHAAAPATGDIVVAAVGVRNGSPDVRFGSVTMSFGALTTVSMDLTGLDATTYSRRLYLDGALVNAQNGLASGETAAATADAVTGGACRAERTSDNVIYVLALDAPVDIVGVGVADEIRMIPEAPTTGLEGITAVGVGAADTGDLVIDDGRLVMFGNAHRRSGDARMTSVGGDLRVSNLGSSGFDGIVIDFADADAFDVSHEARRVDVNLGQYGLVATGTVDDTVGSPLGACSIFSGSGFTVVRADFTPISTSNVVRIQVYDDGALTGEALRDGGGSSNICFLFPVAPDPLAPVIGIGVRPGDNPGFHYEFDGALDVRTGVSPTTRIAFGDEIRLLADDPDSQVAALDSLYIAMSLGSALIVTGEAGGCDLASGDTNGDGCVDFEDLSAVIAAWNDVGEPGFPGDATCDGLVTFADIVVVLATWGEGCP